MERHGGDLESQYVEPAVEEGESPPLDKEQHRTRGSDSSSSGSSWSTNDYHGKDDHDGHRPSGRELAQSISRSRTRGESLYRTRSGAPGAAGAISTSLAQPITRAISRRDTILSRVRTRPTVPPFDHPLAHQPTTTEVLVDFDGKDDPYRPINWPTKKKVLTTALYGLCTMSASWASSSYSAGTSQIARHFHVGEQVSTLGTSLFLFGFGLGPLLWAPLSEVYGRRVAVLVPMFVGACFSFGSAAAKDLQTLMITRFFGAFFSSAPVTNTGGVLGDLYDPSWRGIAMAGYAMAVVGGPCVGMSSFLPIYLSVSNTLQDYLEQDVNESQAPSSPLPSSSTPPSAGDGRNTSPASFKPPSSSSAQSTSTSPTRPSSSSPKRAVSATNQVIGPCTQSSKNGTFPSVSWRGSFSSARCRFSCRLFASSSRCMRRSATGSYTCSSAACPSSSGRRAAGNPYLLPYPSYASSLAPSSGAAQTCTIKRSTTKPTAQPGTAPSPRSVFPP